LLIKLTSKGYLIEWTDSEVKSHDILINNAALPYESIMEGTYVDWQYNYQRIIYAYFAYLK